MVKAAARQPVPARRADAERNIAAILEAGTRLLSADPTASVADIAKAAGVGRVTLYGHFPSREALVDAVLDHAVGMADAVLEDESIDTAPAPEAMAGLLRSSWEVLDRHRRLFLAADRVLATERIREHHEAPAAAGRTAHRAGATGRRLPRRPAVAVAGDRVLLPHPQRRPGARGEPARAGGGGGSADQDDVVAAPLARRRILGEAIRLRGRRRGTSGGEESDDVSPQR
ncbi:hypothetical protein GCM10020220_037150 [Nonomuraea rubra]|uniref:TetR/AcrR family transcriptional regulator n=1 Tax=Nonomuraea rubra TaxID=46180 RepID=UPI0031E64DA6